MIWYFQMMQNDCHMLNRGDFSQVVIDDLPMFSILSTILRSNPITQFETPLVVYIHLYVYYYTVTHALYCNYVHIYHAWAWSWLDFCFIMCHDLICGLFHAYTWNIFCHVSSRAQVILAQNSTQKKKRFVTFLPVREPFWPRNQPKMNFVSGFWMGFGPKSSRRQSGTGNVTHFDVQWFTTCLMPQTEKYAN